jgi:hypothetical protein
VGIAAGVVGGATGAVGAVVGVAAVPQANIKRKPLPRRLMPLLWVSRASDSSLPIHTMFFVNLNRYDDSIYTEVNW